MPHRISHVFIRTLSFFSLLAGFALFASIAESADTTPPPVPLVTDTGATAVWTQPYTLVFTIAGNDPESGVVSFGYNLHQDSPTGPVVSSNPELFSSQLQSLGSTQLYIPADMVTIGKTYYLEARVKNGVGLWSAWGHSDGILVVGSDTTPPAAPVVTDDGQYTTSTTTLHASWSASDAESGIAEYQYKILQKLSNGNLATLIDWTSTGTANQATRSDIVSLVGKQKVNGLPSGTLYFFQVKAKNGVDLWSDVGVSDGITADNTPPDPVTVTDDGATTTGTSSLHAVWTAASDPHSGIAGYEYEIRRDSASGSFVRGWTSVGNVTQITAPNLFLTLGASYFIGVRSTNGAGLVSAAAYSDGILVQPTDTTPPTAPGQPTEGLVDKDVSQSSFVVFWPAAADPESGINCYQLEERVGTTGSWGPVGSCFTSAPSYSITGRTEGNTYYYRVKAKNGADLFGPYSPVSDGVLIDSTAPVVSPIGVTNITATSVSLNWTTNEPATCVVRCGTSPSPTTDCATTVSGTSHNAVLSSLSASTLYYVSAICDDAAFNQSTGTTSFTTAAAAVPGQPSVVTISGRQLLLRRRNPDGTLAPAAPYIIRGVDWSPAGKTTAAGGTALIRRPEFGKWYQTDIPLMKTMNVNTLRTFMDLGVPGDSGVTVSGLSILDELYRKGIMVIMTVDDGNGTSARVSQAVNYYKNHPAILAWSLGSEWNINLFWSPGTTQDQAAQRIEDEAATIKSLDANHPVISSYGEFDLYQPTGPSTLQGYVNRAGSNIDIWSFNLYRGFTFGGLWTQWAAITASNPKPMFIAEYGIDAFHATQHVNNNPAGSLNPTEQAQWNQALWDDIARNLSANDPAKLALGGTLFEWSDEWWKAGGPGSQETSGWFSDGFPDGMGNEEYFGLLDVDRTARQTYTAMQNGFSPGYVPAALPQTVSFKAFSRGGYAEEWSGQYGVAQLFGANTMLFARYGGGGGGRGIDVAAIDRATGQLRQPAENFDLWYEAVVPARDRMVSFINSQPNGTIFVMAVADTSGTNLSTGCTANSYFEPVIQALEGLGSTLIRGYCFRASWAMIAVKGEGVKAEQINNSQVAGAAPVSVSANIQLQ